MSNTEIIMFAIIIPFIFTVVLYFLIERLVERNIMIILLTLGKLFTEANLLSEEKVNEAFEKAIEWTDKK